MNIFQVINDLYGEVIENNEHSISINNYVTSILKFIITGSKFRTCLEIGTLHGKSALIIGQLLLKNAHLYQISMTDLKLITIENNEQNYKIAIENFSDSSICNLIKPIFGDALNILASTLKDEKFDLIFIDANKSSYMKYFEWSLNHLNQGGVIVIDNVLLHKINPKYMNEANKTHIVLNELLQSVINSEKYNSILIPYGRGNHNQDALLIVKIN